MVREKQRQPRHRQPEEGDDEQGVVEPIEHVEATDRVRVGLEPGRRAASSRLDGGPDAPQDRVHEEEAEGARHHDDEVPPHRVEQGVAGAVEVVRVRVEACETLGRALVAASARLDSVVAVKPRSLVADGQDVVGPVAVTAPRGPR